MPAVTRQQKITFGEMRSTGVRGILIYCADYHCSHSIAISRAYRETLASPGYSQGGCAPRKLTRSD
jgi:hypothetical protein